MGRSRFASFQTAWFVVSICALLLLACAGIPDLLGSTPSDGNSSSQAGQENPNPNTGPRVGANGSVPEPTPETSDAGAEPSSEATSTPLPANARVIYMLGRSVTGNWFNYWNWEGDTATPVVRNQVVLFRREIDTPEGMVNSVREIVGEIPKSQNATVQWKFCFDDFSGGDDAKPAIERNKTIVQQVYHIVVEQNGRRLIIGNALPKVQQDTDPAMVAAQRQYNQWLVEFEQAHAGQVFVFDQYSVLADSNGALRANYASARDDSHPNATAYRALDSAYFTFLGRVPK